VFIALIKVLTATLLMKLMQFSKNRHVTRPHQHRFEKLNVFIKFTEGLLR
jgi:hypothetical protein